MATTIADVARAIEIWAPPETAEDWDVVGLHVGEPGRTVTCALIALDMTPAVLEEAVKLDAQLIVTHHPLLLKPVSRLSTESPTGHLAFRLAEERIALYCAHTNLDRARDGVSFELARRLGANNLRFLGALDERLVKLVVFVPETHAEAVRRALSAAGAGHIGRYEACSFSSAGTGRFKPLEGSNPAIGQAGGDLEAVDEIRIEVEVSRWGLSHVLSAVRESHPYEEVAYDVYPVEQPYRDAGYGAIGELDQEETLERFLHRVSTALDNPALRYVGDLSGKIRTVAVCGGAGTPLIALARRQKADVYVTADLSHHRYFEVMDLVGEPRMAMIDAGHYETERPTEDILRDFLAGRFPDVGWAVTANRTGAARTYVRPR
jgi:dinuclear metal center YbgI/SA1388 family protein